MKPKEITIELIEDLDSEPYQILKDMRKYHEDTADARIALAWRMKLKPDKDLHLVLGKCVKASDLQREFADYDYVILLNRDVWEDAEFTDEKRAALMDHELSHAAPARDSEGAVRWDSRGRMVWRVRKHDLEEFFGVAERHGCYKRDLVIFAESLERKRRTPLLEAVG